MSSPFHQPHSGVPSLPLYCKPDPHQFWLDPGYYNPRRTFWTLEDHLKDKLDSIIRLPSSNKMTILWGLGCLESSPTKDTFWVGKALFRPLRSDKPEFLTRYDDYLEDIKELSRVGMIESFKVKSPDVLSEKHIITISLPGDPIPDFGHSIVTWAVMSGHAEELFIQSVKGIARRPQGDVDRDINRLWNLYQIIQTGMTGLCPPRRFSARKRVQYARMLFQYAVEVSDRVHPLLMMTDNLLSELHVLATEVYPTTFYPPITSEETKQYIWKRLPELYSQRKELAIRLSVE